MDTVNTMDTVVDFYDYFTPGTYNPPNAHYTQVPCFVEKKYIKNLIGKNAKIFNAITKAANVDYLWYDNNRNVIEIWGPENNLLNAKHRLIERMNKIQNDIEVNV